MPIYEEDMYIEFRPLATWSNWWTLLVEGNANPSRWWRLRPLLITQAIGVIVDPELFVDLFLLHRR